MSNGGSVLELPAPARLRPRDSPQPWKKTSALTAVKWFNKGNFICFLATYMTIHDLHVHFLIVFIKLLSVSGEVVVLLFFSTIRIIL